MSRVCSVSMAWSRTFRSSSVTYHSYISLSASLSTGSLSGSGSTNKKMPSNLSKWLLHQLQSSSISAHKPKLKDTWCIAKWPRICFIVRGHPVTYATCTLTTAEQKYYQVDKELLAQVFGLEHNHHYIFRKQMKFWIGQKTLVSIYKKPLASVRKRLQKLLLRLQQYNGDLRYKPGSEIYLADTLSRASLKNTTKSKAETETESIHATDFLSITESQLKEIQEETAQDDTHQQPKKTIISGWKKSLHASIRILLLEMSNHHNMAWSLQEIAVSSPWFCAQELKSSCQERTLECKAVFDGPGKPYIGREWMPT